MRFSAFFGEVFGQTALSSLTYEREFFRCLLAGIFERPLLRVTEKMQETGVTVFRPYRNKNIKPFADVMAKWQHILLRYFKSVVLV